MDKFILTAGWYRHRKTDLISTADDNSGCSLPVDLDTGLVCDVLTEEKQKQAKWPVSL